MKLFATHLAFTLKRIMRRPEFWIPTVVLPAMLYSFVGASLPPAGPPSQAAIASFAIFAVMGIGLYQFAIAIAEDRETAFSLWQRTLAGAAAPQLTAQVVTAVVLSFIAVLLVLAAAALFAKTGLDMGQMLRLSGVAVLMSLPAALLGTVIGYLAWSASGASSLATLINLPLAFLGALWIPPGQMPTAIARISEWTPTRAMVEFAWAAVFDGRTVDGWYYVSLAAWTSLFIVLAAWLMRRDRKRRFA